MVCQVLSSVSGFSSFLETLSLENLSSENLSAFLQQNRLRLITENDANNRVIEQSPSIPVEKKTEDRKNCEGRNRRRRRARAGGGGGGGGQGSHVHNPATDGHHGPSTGGGGQRGNRGTFDSRGTGGSGGDDRGRARGGDGGNGGYLGQDGQGASGGQGGHAGRSIIIEGPGHGAQRGHITYQHQGDLRGPVQDHNLGDGDRNDS